MIKCEGMKTVQFSVASDRGLVRATNEDSYCLLPLEQGVLAAVADGIGGQLQGEVASGLAIRTLEEALGQGVGATSEERGRRLEEAVALAQARILRASEDQPPQSRMGTTLTAVLVWDLEAHVAHVGDSRLYRFGSATLRQVTRDHSVVGEMIGRGELSPDQAEHHPQRHVLSRWLGHGGDGTPDTLRLTLGAGEGLLLCSDGLSSQLSDAEILEVLTQGGALDELAWKLVRTVNRRGGSDNTTVVLIRTDRE